MVDSFRNKDDAFGQITASPRQFEEPSESTIFFTVLYQCGLVLGGPIVAFFVTKMMLLNLLEWESKEIKTDVTSAIVAIVVLHLALFYYIINAYLGDKKEKIGK